MHNLSCPSVYGEISIFLLFPLATSEACGSVVSWVCLGKDPGDTIRSYGSGEPKLRIRPSFRIFRVYGPFPRESRTLTAAFYPNGLLHRVQDGFAVEINQLLSDLV